MQFYFHIISISKSLLAALAFCSHKRCVEGLEKSKIGGRKSRCTLYADAAEFFFSTCSDHCSYHYSGHSFWTLHTSFGLFISSVNAVKLFVGVFEFLPVRIHLCDQISIFDDECFPDEKHTHNLRLEGNARTLSHRWSLGFYSARTFRCHAVKEQSESDHKALYTFFFSYQMFSEFKIKSPGFKLKV